MSVLRAPGASILLTGIAELTTNDPERAGEDLLARVRDAAVVVEGDRIAWTGPAAHAPDADERVDLGGRAVLPGWVDSHSHLVFAGDRTREFEARMAGQPYAAGGILTTVTATRAASDEELRAGLRRHVAEALAQGTTTLETKTGYGLTPAEELRAARLAGEFVEEVTWLGAHVVAPGADPGDYLAELLGPQLDAVRGHVRWADVFCETGAFDEDASRAVLLAARDAGLGLRVHGNQLTPGPGVRLACELGAASVDHVNHLAPADVDALAGSATVATVLPACDLSTRQPLAPARRLLDAGASVAIASNCNPGSSYTSSVAFCVATAVLQMGLTVAEAVHAATAGGAAALRRTDVGRVVVGARADLHVLDAPSVTHLAYRPGVPLTHAVWRAGVRAAGG
ncbi:imidazolonepropionase [Kineococcus radiotolerans]|uniref:Imidazolonepropionase n=1 Tax=Kineococcus radiotolerans TaxID=131568 RepID=A0A7W4TM99_KINRA|nr:imidazolonepropionase [Kineococcus radiotolerans]MBB2901435.1 imidazolonepropionase [Kineococcus radiotolerans]